MTSIRSDFSVQALGQGLLVALVGYATRSPPILIEAVAGLALIGAFGSAMLSGVQDEQDRLPGLTTLSRHRLRSFAVRHRLRVLGAGARAARSPDIPCALVPGFRSS